MKLFFKQRFFSWFDNYDIYDESGNTIFVVKGDPDWGHLLRIYDTNGNELGYMKKKPMTWLPKFKIYIGGRYAGCVSKEFSISKRKLNIDYGGWRVDGSLNKWDYMILASAGDTVAKVTKEVWNLKKVYAIDVRFPSHAIYALMLVLAINAEMCSKN